MRPAEFGGFALFMTVVGIFGPIACGRFDLIIQSAPDRQLPALIARARRANILVSTALAVAQHGIRGTEREDQRDRGAARRCGGVPDGMGTDLECPPDPCRTLFGRCPGPPLSALQPLPRTQIVLAFLNPTALGLIIGFCVGFAVQAAFPDPCGARSSRPAVHAAPRPLHHGALRIADLPGHTDGRASRDRSQHHELPGPRPLFAGGSRLLFDGLPGRCTAADPDLRVRSPKSSIKRRPLPSGQLKASGAS